MFSFASVLAAVMSAQSSQSPPLYDLEARRTAIAEIVNATG